MLHLASRSAVGGEKPGGRQEMDGALSRAVLKLNYLLCVKSVLSRIPHYRFPRVCLPHAGHAEHLSLWVPRTQQCVPVTISHWPCFLWYMMHELQSPSGVLCNCVTGFLVRQLRSLLRLLWSFMMKVTTQQGAQS